MCVCIVVVVFGGFIWYNMTRRGFVLLCKVDGVVLRGCSP
jgi:hypothetical protein